MYLLGHATFTAAAARAVEPRVDLRWAALMSLLPDAIDKPLRLLAPSLVNENTRGFAHSLLGAAAALAVLLALRGRLRHPVLLWGCWLGHLLLDRLWLGDGPAIALWPFLGPFPPPVREPGRSWPIFVYNAVAELAALALLLYMTRRRGLRPSLRLVWRDGALP